MKFYSSISALLFLSAASLYAQDTDNDGAPDSYEVATGFDPANADSTPPPAPMIGINFRRANFPLDETAWPADVTNGFLPQVNWNQDATGGLTGSPTNEGTIFSPVEGVAIDAAGNQTTLKYEAIEGDENPGASRTTLRGNLAARLLDAFLFSRSGFTFSAEQVPYANYDLYLYLSGIGNLADNRLTLNPGTSSEQFLRVRPKFAQEEISFIESERSRPDLPNSANVAVFRDVSGASFTLDMVDPGLTGVGLAAIQIVDRTADSDGDGVPDWWELSHQTDASVANAGDDLDGDGLSNLQEYQRLTEPRDADSDDDLLSDLVETNTGIYLSPANTGTDPNFPNSDDEGRSDYEEIFSLISSDPNLPDTDSDGVTDLDEVNGGSDPRDINITGVPLPEVTSATNFDWTVSNVQIRWDHTRPVLNNKWFCHFDLEEISDGDFVSTRLATDGISFGLEILDSNSRALNFRIGYNKKFWGVDERFGLALRGEEDLSSACGFSKSGVDDFSDRLTFQVNGERQSTGRWNLRFRIINQDTGVTVVDHLQEDLIPGDIIEQGSAVWRNAHEREPVSSAFQDEAIEVYLNAEKIESLENSNAIADIDNDGLPDVWADRFGVTGSAADADGDGLSNLEEFNSGTNPTEKDSDSDGVNDDLEVRYFSDATDQSLSPYLALVVGPSGSDLDGNGLSDLWETRFSRGLSLNADADSDGDGYSNRQEDIAGTDPFDVNSYLSLLFMNDEGEMKLLWDSHPDKVTRLQGSDRLSVFENIAGARSGYVISPNGEMNFFRVTRADQDRDNDGLTDADERLLGTDPLDANSAGRSIPQDLNGDGTPETMVSGDYARFANSYANRESITSPDSATQLTSTEASRFLMQTTFGPTAKDISKLRKMGLEAWLDDQMNDQPTSSYDDIVKIFTDDLFAGRVNPEILFVENGFTNGPILTTENINTVFATNAIKGGDQLRQRMAFALSQYFVVSSVGNNGSGLGGLARYHDLLLENAFGNFYDLLKKITRSLEMGRYLTHVGNQKADPSINRFPDENYAREVMQLFTIGIHELNNDGSLKRDEDDELIETYGQDDVIEMARVMTGFKVAFRDPNDFFSGNGFLPMEMNPERHDFEEKVILRRYAEENDLLSEHTIPAREESVENGQQDVDDALLILFNHTNTPPFVARSFIQFFVTDNPSPAYIERVANVFIDDGEGVRGNMGAMLKAILLDPEARDIAIADARPEFGRLRDPLIRVMHLARILGFDRHKFVHWWELAEVHNDYLGQEPFKSPTVFNFFNPQHKPAGPLLDRNLVGAPFQIMDTITAVTFPNKVWEIIERGFFHAPRSNSAGYELLPSYNEFQTTAQDNETFVDQLNLLLCAGRMQVETRRFILEALSDPRFEGGRDIQAKIKLGLYLATISPEAAITR